MNADYWQQREGESLTDPSARLERIQECPLAPHVGIPAGAAAKAIQGASDRLGIVFQAASRRIAVDDKPLFACAANFRTHALTEDGDRRLVLGHNLRSRRFGLIFLLVGVLCGAAFPALIFGSGSCPPFPESAGLACLSLTFAVSGLLWFAGSRRVCFDPSSGRMTSCSAWSRQSCALADVIAVQLLYGGYHDGDGDVQSYHTYQLNLVLDPRIGPRLNLTHHSDREWTRQAARRIAAFLGAPLVDQIPQGM